MAKLKTRLFSYTFLFTLIICSGCNPFSKEELLPTIAQTQIATEIFIQTPTVLPTSIPVLPYSLYFLTGAQEEPQIWKLESDGISTQQMTYIENGVYSYAVSPSDGRIAYISDNRLFLLDNSGKNPILIADGSSVSENVEDYIFRSEVSSPNFSPDGQFLAYGFDGLHIYNLNTGEDTHLLTNLGNLMDEPFVFSKEVYVPGPWSPDGNLLLIIMGYYEGSTLAVMEQGISQPFRRLRSNGPVCCIFNWSMNSQTMWVANPYFTTDLPGLWKFNAETGEETVVVNGIEDNGSINFVGWPIQLINSDLLFFIANLPHFSPEEGIHLKMVQSDREGKNVQAVRSELFNPREVLWSNDGAFAIILQSNEVKQNQQIILARTSDSPLEILFESGNIRQLKWGP